MDRFSKAAILVTILVILSNAVLISIDIYYFRESTFFLLSSLSIKLLTIIIFTSLIILKLVFKKAVNYLFFCFSTSITIIGILSTISLLIQGSFNKLTNDQKIHNDIGVSLTFNIIWVLMFVFLYFNLKEIKENETIYFLKKEQLNERLKLFKHGIIFWIVILLMSINLFFIVKLGDITDLFASESGFSTLIYILFCIIALIAIFRQSFFLYIFSVCMLTYILFNSILPTLCNFFLSGTDMPLSQKIILLSVQLVSMGLIVIISLQANLHYRKIKYKEDAI